MTVTVHHGDCREMLATLPAESVDSVVCDPPYHLTSIVKRFGSPDAAPAKEGATGAYARASRGFMGKQWDGGDVAFQPETWAAVLRVLKPGAHLVAFGGTRTYHRMACAIEDAGFEVRDTLAWLYGSGFPKSHNIGKAIDKANGDARPKHGVAENFGASRIADGKIALGDFAGQWDLTSAASAASAAWEGWGTALKPAFEPIILARKPFRGTVAANVQKHGTGAINVDGCRIGETVETWPSSRARPADGFPNALYTHKLAGQSETKTVPTGDSPPGRWPANVLHDGSDEVLQAFPETHAPGSNGSSGTIGKGSVVNFGLGPMPQRESYSDPGSAARFFKECTLSVEDIAWMTAPANYAVACSNLQSEAAVSVLAHAVERSIAGSALQRASYRAPSTSATASEFEALCESVITVTRNIALASSRESPPRSITLESSLAKCAAQCGPTGTMTITASHWKSDGSAAPVTFDITLPSVGHGERVSASRLHYTAKADAADRLGSKHPTVKPVDLMRWLVRLVTPKGGLVLDPFAGTGTTGMAALMEGMRAVLIEREAEYVADINRRLAHMKGGDAPLFAEHAPPCNVRAAASTGDSRTNDRTDRIETVTA